MSQSNKELYEFSRFRLDVSERLLWRDGKRVPLTDKAFDTLCVLVKRDGAEHVCRRVKDSDVVRL